MSCCVNIHRWGTYTLQTGRQVHTPEGQWSDGGSLAGVSSFYLLYQGRLQGCRAAAGPPRVSDSNDIVQGKPQQTPLWPGILHTFSTLKTLQLHGFLLHFLLSTGFREVSRIRLVDSVDGKSGLYSDSLTHTHTHAHQGEPKYIILMTEMLRVYHNLVECSHRTSKECHHPRSPTSESLQKQTMLSF